MVVSIGCFQLCFMGNGCFTIAFHFKLVVWSCRTTTGGFYRVFTPAMFFFWKTALPGTQVEQIQKPRPKKGEVLVKVRACGVCHTDPQMIWGCFSYSTFFAWNNSTSRGIFVLMEWNQNGGQKKRATVDGRNPAPVDMVNILLFTGFLGF